MDNDISHTDISKNELNLLIHALTKSVDMNYSKRFFWVALVLAFFIGMAVAYISIPVKRLHGPETATVCLEESDEIKNKMHEIDLKVDRLTALTDSLVKKQDVKKDDHQQEVTIQKQQEKTDDKLRAPGDSKQLKALYNASDYTVTIHYNAENGKKIILNLSEFLKGKGYHLPDIQTVKYNKNDIRYFHKKDQDVAIILKNEVSRFIAEHTGENINLKLINLEKIYPEAPFGQIELWINLL
jgi:hypothetical protein